MNNNNPIGSDESRITLPRRESESSGSDKALKVLVATSLAFGTLAVISLLLDITLGNQIGQWAKSAYSQASHITQNTVSKASMLANKAVTWIKGSTQLSANFSVPNWAWVASGGGLLAIATTIGTIVVRYNIRKAVQDYHYYKDMEWKRWQRADLERILVDVETDVKNGNVIL